MAEGPALEKQNQLHCGLGTSELYLSVQEPHWVVGAYSYHIKGRYFPSKDFTLPGLSGRAFPILSNRVQKFRLSKGQGQGFPGGSVVKNPPTNARDIGSISDPGKSHVL